MSKKSSKVKKHAQGSATETVVEKTQPSAAAVKNQKEAVKADIVKKITNEKDVKYNYPADCDSLPKRKKFRTQARAKIESLTARYRKVKDGKVEGDVKAVQAELTEFLNRTYTKEHMPAIKDLIPAA